MLQFSTLPLDGPSGPPQKHTTSSQMRQRPLRLRPDNYMLKDFEDAFARYLPKDDATSD